MKLHATRYTDLSWPEYRFLPGRDPHPHTYPEGHSSRSPGESPPPVEFKSADQWRESVDYLFGCDLYNHGYWWEAHETWEGLWQLTDKSQVQGQFLQTLIQVAAGHLKLHMGKLAGVENLRQSAARHSTYVIQQIGDSELMGLPFKEWYGRVNEYYAHLLTSPDPQHDIKIYPYIALRR